MRYFGTHKRMWHLISLTYSVYLQQVLYATIDLYVHKGGLAQIFVHARAQFRSTQTMGLLCLDEFWCAGGVEITF